MMNRKAEYDQAVDERFMHRALELAQYAEEAGEIPVGAVLVYQGEIIAEGWNQPISKQDPTAHAEITVLQKGAQAIKNYRLVDTTLYVTLEPCMMCAGSLVHARIHRLVFGAPDPKAGAIQSVAKLLDSPWLNHRVHITGHVLEEKASQLLKSFFLKKRQEK